MYSPLLLKREIRSGGFGFILFASNALLSEPETLATNAIGSFGVQPGPGNMTIDTLALSSSGSWVEAVMNKLVEMLTSTFSMAIRQRLRFIAV